MGYRPWGHSQLDTTEAKVCTHYAFYIKDLSIHGFWPGNAGKSWKQSLRTPWEGRTYCDPDDEPSRVILHLLMVKFLNLLTEIGRIFFCVSKYVLVVPMMTESL